MFIAFVIDTRKHKMQSLHLFLVTKKKWGKNTLSSAHIMRNMPYLLLTHGHHVSLRAASSHQWHGVILEFLIKEAINCCYGVIRLADIWPILY